MTLLAPAPSPALNAASGPVRWGVLGAARIAVTRMIPALCKAAGAAPFAIASRNAATAREAAATAGAPRAYGDYEAMLADPDVEAVYIPLPNTLHVAWCLKALAAGKAVLCEKPVALTSADAARLITARDAAGRPIEEAFSYRNHPQWSDIAGLIAEGAIGAPRGGHALLAKQFNDPADIRNDPALGGGALYDLGAYAISAMNAVFGRPPIRVSAVLTRDATGVDTLSSAILDYGDAQATFTVGIRAGPDGQGTHQRFSVLGERGWLAADFPFAQAWPSTCRLMLGDDQSVGSLPSRVWSYPPVDQYVLQVERFSRLVRGEAGVRAWPLEDALVTLRVIEALDTSNRNGGWTSVVA